MFCLSVLSGLLLGFPFLLADKETKAFLRLQELRCPKVTQVNWNLDPLNSSEIVFEFCTMRCFLVSGLMEVRRFSKETQSWAPWTQCQTVCSLYFVLFNLPPFPSVAPPLSSYPYSVISPVSNSL